MQKLDFKHMLIGKAQISHRVWSGSPLSTNRIITGINMVFHALTFARSRGRCWKPRPKASVFNTSQGTWRLLMHWKTMFGRYYCIKTGYISHYFLHYFVSPFHRCRANAIFTDYARSRQGSTHVMTAAILLPRYEHLAVSDQDFFILSIKFHFYICSEDHSFVS